MNNSTEMPEIDPRVNANAVSVYGQDEGLDDFPVLKAFQQYIDAEQSKARKRMLSLCIFFGFLMTCVIVVFVLLVMNVSARNQQLNDRLIEYAMNREWVQQPSGSAVVVQPPQDSAAILALTAKLDGLQKKLAEDQDKAEKAAKDAAEQARLAAIEASKPKGASPQELEIKRLRSLLANEIRKNTIESERKRQAEIEAYRRKHYPELYEDIKAPSTSRKSKRRSLEEEAAEVDAEIADIIDEANAINYFEEDEQDPLPQKPAVEKKERSIPADAKGSSVLWNIPTE